MPRRREARQRNSVGPERIEEAVSVEIYFGLVVRPFVILDRDSTLKGPA